MPDDDTGRPGQGFILSYRSMIGHPVVWQGGPLYFQLWSWLLHRAQWRDEPSRLKNGVIVRRGQLFTTYASMATALRYRRGRGFSEPPRDQLRAIIQTFADEGMIRKDAPRANPMNDPANAHRVRGSKANGVRSAKANGVGLLITICNYESYQVREIKSPQGSAGKSPQGSNGERHRESPHEDKEGVQNKGKTCTSANAAASPDGDISRRIITAYRTYVLKGAKMTDAARGKLKTRLQNFSPAELERAIANFAANDWQMAHNRTRGLAWLLHTDDRVLQHLNATKANGTGGGKAGPGGVADDAPFDYNAYRKARDEAIARGDLDDDEGDEPQIDF